MKRKTRAERTKARAEYVFQRKSARSVAQAIGVSTGTVQRWKRMAKEAGDDWDLARSAHLVAGEGLESVFGMVIEEFALFAQSTIEDIKTNKDIDPTQRVSLLTKLADSMSKTATATSRLSPKLSELGIAQDVISRLLEFVRQHHPNHAEAMLEILEPFGHEIAGAYS